ncbi:Rossmann-like domain-containing protein [Methylocystis heyeri]|uniref:DUF2478 domain-containing protein n=1 Tax=Methylocystis heyeri TaxID=391905 RepID=A0A6B8KEZ8_9HYPH|nr:DUF364 domain-containing protein [Methylocystis heyeri]QGM46866.1 DUF2478 domain-containing protein [Methylocystis heyeri]
MDSCRAPDLKTDRIGDGELKIITEVRSLDGANEPAPSRLGAKSGSVRRNRIGSTLASACREERFEQLSSSETAHPRAAAGEHIMQDVNVSRRSAVEFRAVPTPWIRPGVVVHDAGLLVDALLEEFSLVLRSRGFDVHGYVQRSDRDCTRKGDGCSIRVNYRDVGSEKILSLERGAVAALLREARSRNSDLVVFSRFSACLPLDEGVEPAFQLFSKGPPILTSIAGQCVEKWHSRTGHEGALLAPDIKSLWRWWGPERLYRDLILGVDESEVRRIVCGARWIMVEGPSGTGLAYLPKHPRELASRLPRHARESLRTLAELAQSTDPLDTALGVAAINAHYNRVGLDAKAGNGAKKLRDVPGRPVAIGAFPGIDGIFPDCTVVETDPRPNEYPLAALDALLPGRGAAVINSSALINRSLSRILRLAASRDVALIGPSTPLTPRLFDYGLRVLGGLIVDDTDGLANAIASGALPREFGRFGRFVHLDCSESSK